MGRPRKRSMRLRRGERDMEGGRGQGREESGQFMWCVFAFKCKCCDAIVNLVLYMPPFRPFGLRPPAVCFGTRHRCPDLRRKARLGPKQRSRVGDVSRRWSPQAHSLLQRLRCRGKDFYSDLEPLCEPGRRSDQGPWGGSQSRHPVSLPPAPTNDQRLPRLPAARLLGRGGSSGRHIETKRTTYFTYLDLEHQPQCTPKLCSTGPISRK